MPSSTPLLTLVEPVIGKEIQKLREREGVSQECSRAFSM